MAQTIKNLPAMQETQVRFLSQEDPLEKGMVGMVTHPSTFAWRVPRTEEPGELLVHGVTKESDTTEARTRSALV